MATFTHAVYIDESGTGWQANDLNSLWVTTGVAVPFEKKSEVDSGLRSILSTYCRRWMKELKGSDLPRGLRSDDKLSQLTSDVASLIAGVKAYVWTIGTRHGANPPTGPLPPDAKAKDIARQLFLERFNGFLQAGYCDPDHFLIVWDVSDVQEQMDFSASVATFRNAINNQSLSPRMAPAVLGGLSHDWSGLQLADFVSNMALHRIGRKYNLPGTNADKATNFDAFLEPLHMVDAKGKRIGWKIW